MAPNIPKTEIDDKDRLDFQKGIEKPSKTESKDVPTPDDALELHKEAIEQVMGLPRFGPDNIFVFHYRARFRPTEDPIVANDIQDARQKAINYCHRFGITFISVRPLFLDLAKKPRDIMGRQPDKVEE